MPYTWEVKYVATTRQIPIFFGMVIFSYEGISMVLPLENQMQTPKEMKVKLASDMKMTWKYILLLCVFHYENAIPYTIFHNMELFFIAPQKIRKVE